MILSVGNFWGELVIDGRLGFKARVEVAGLEGSNKGVPSFCGLVCLLGVK